MQPPRRSRDRPRPAAAAQPRAPQPWRRRGQTDGGWLGHPGVKNCQSNAYLTKVELLFYFWSLQREQNTGWGAGGGPSAAGEAQLQVPPPRLARASRQDVALPVSSSPAGTPKGCPHPRHRPVPVDGITGTAAAAACSPPPHTSSHQTPWASRAVGGYGALQPGRCGAGRGPACCKAFHPQGPRAHW